MNAIFSPSQVNRRELIEKMAPMDVMELSLALPWEQRLRILEESPAFPEIINSYPVQELYWTIKAVGPRDSLSALRVLTPERIQFFFDLEWWQKDRFSTRRALSWMILLMEAREDKLLEWATYIHRIDKALLPLLFRSFFQVIKRPDDMDIQEARDALPPFTLDDVYYIRFHNVELQPLWGRFLALLFSERLDIYRDVMESILWETATEQMEAAYRWRNARLSDHGIPEYFQAIDIFAHVKRTCVRRVNEGGADAVVAGNDLPISFVPTLYMGGARTLINAISRLKGTTAMERIIHEWIGVANKIIVAKSIDIDEPDMLLDALIEASSLINLGLECHVRDTGDPPHEALKHAVIEDLVRYGVGLAKDARRFVFEFSKRPHVSGELFELPDGLRERIRAVLHEPPRVWDHEKYRTRPLESVIDIEGIERDVMVVRDLLAVMERIEPHWSTWNESISLEGTNLHHIHELDLLTGLLTALGNYLITGTAEVIPVDEVMLPTLFRLLDHGARLDEVMNVMVGGLHSTLSPPFLEMLDDRVHAVLDDWRSMGRPAPVDGLFVSGLLVRLDSHRT